MNQPNETRETNIQKAGAVLIFKALVVVARDLWKRAISLLRSTRIQRREKRMQLVERIAVGNKQSVILLRVDGKEIVVGCTGDNLVLLGVNEPKQLASQPLVIEAGEILPATPATVLPKAPRAKKNAVATPKTFVIPQLADAPAVVKPIRTKKKTRTAKAVPELQTETRKAAAMKSPRAKTIGRPKLMKQATPKTRQRKPKPAYPETALLNSSYGKAWINGASRRVQ